MWWLWAFGAVAIAYTIRKWFKHLRNSLMVKDLPGSSSWSIFPFVETSRKLLLLCQSDKETTIAVFKMREKLINQFRREGIARSSAGSRPLVLVFKAELVEEVLKSPSFVDKGLGYDFLRDWLGNGLITSNGPTWKTQRRMLTPSFHFKILDEFEGIMIDHSSKIIKMMKENPADLIDFELSKWATDCTMSILLETVMGLEQSDPQASREYIEGLEELITLLMRRFSRPWNLIDAFYFNSEDGKRYLRAVAKSHDFTLKAIMNKVLELKEHPERMEARPGRKPAFLDMLVKLFLEGEQLSIEEIREQTDTFMFAGHDTTGWAIAWALFQLGHLPEVQAKLREEFLLVFGKDSTCGLTQDKLKDLKYFDRVLKECMRRYPSVPSVSRRCALDGARLGKYKLPMDATVVVSIYGLHRDPEVFPDPEKFDPDRFLPERAQGRSPYAFIPFSAGARNCIGQRFALQELRIILVAILRNFEIRSKVPLESIDIAGEIILRAKQDLIVDFIPLE